MVKRPAYINKVQLAFEEARPADISSAMLERALLWLDEFDALAEDRDGDLLTLLIEDELDFRK